MNNFSRRRKNESATAQAAHEVDEIETGQKAQPILEAVHFAYHADIVLESCRAQTVANARHIEVGNWEV